MIGHKQPAELNWRSRILLGVLAIGLAIAVSGCQKAKPVAQLISEAAAARKGGDYPAAVIKLENALAQDPKNILARLLAAQIYIDLQQGDAALGLVKRAQNDGASELDIAKLRAEAELTAHHYDDAVNDTATMPSSASSEVKASLFASRALALGALGKNAAAQEALEQGLNLDPHSVDLRIAASRLALAKGDVVKARQELGRASQEASTDSRLDQLEGDIAYVARDFATAAQNYQKIIKAEPWNQRARGDLAASQLANDKLTEASATLDKILKDPDLAKVPKDPILSHIRAIIAYRQKDYHLAQSYAESVVSRAPNFEPARLIAAASSYALHEYERANYYIGPYVIQEPHDDLARKLLAAIQLRLNHPGEAIKALSPITDAAVSDDPELLALIGVASARSGDPRSAVAYLRLALEQQPDNLLLRTVLGKTEIALGDPKAAIEDLEQAVKARTGSLGAQVPLFLAYMQMKEYDKALALAENSITREPSTPTGYLLASSVYLVQGNVAAGRTALQKAREIHPGDVNADHILAKLALIEGNIDDARRYYRELIKYNPQSIPAYIELADIEARIKQRETAEEVLFDGLRANPDDLVLNAVLARFQLSEGKTQDSLSRAQQTLQRFPRNSALLDIIGRAQLALGQSDAALSTFRDLVEIAPKAAWAHADLAEAYLAHFRPDNPQWPAINEATQAVQLDPHDKAAALVLARALVTHGRLREAQEVVNSLKSGDGGDDLVVIELEGLIARGEGRLADAVPAFSKAVALEDNSLDRRRLADTQRRLGLTDDAARTLTAWLDARPSDIEARELLADIYLRDGRLSEASQQYHDLAEREPKNVTFQNNLAWVISRMGHPQDALGPARQALALAPDSVDALDTLGEVLLQSGLPTEAVVLLEQAWEKSSHRPDVGFHLSQALAATGKTHEASNLLRGLLASDRAFEERTQAKQLLQQLGG